MLILKKISFLLQIDKFLKLKEFSWLSVLDLEFLLYPIANELLSKLFVILLQILEVLHCWIMRLR